MVKVEPLIIIQYNPVWKSEHKDREAVRFIKIKLYLLTRSGSFNTV